MFKILSKKEYQGLLNKINNLEIISESKINYSDLVECDECSQLIFKSKAIKKKVIEKEFFPFILTSLCGSYEEVCKTKYFCKKCGKKYLKEKIKP